jgi:hypothetical protein
MPDFIFYDALFSAPVQTGYVLISQAAQPARFTHYPKFVCAPSGTVHAVWCYVDAVVHARMYSLDGVSMEVNRMLINLTGTDVAPGGMADSFGSELLWNSDSLQTIVTVGSDGGMYFSINESFYDPSPTQNYQLLNPSVVIGDSCAPTFPAGDRLQFSVNYGLESRYYSAGYNLAGGGGFAGFYTTFYAFKSDALNTSYSLQRKEATDGTNNYFPQKCFIPDTAPAPVADADFFDALLRASSSSLASAGAGVSAQIPGTQLMGVAIFRSLVGGNSTFDFYVISFEPHDRESLTCDPDNITLEWRELFYSEITLSSLNNNNTSRFALVAGTSGWILSIGGRQLETSYQEFAVIARDGRVQKYTFNLAPGSQVFETGVTNFCGIFVGPNGQLMYANNEVGRLYVGQAPQPFVDPFPLPNGVAKGNVIPVSGFRQGIEFEDNV